MSADNQIIIKRVKKGSHDGHHGGQWKVAYADFVTAMMASFLLIWLIHTTTPEQERGIADYFAPQSISQTSSGAGGVLGGKVLATQGTEAGAITTTEKKPPPTPPVETHAKEKLKGQNVSADNKDKAAAAQNDDHLKRAVPPARDRDFESAAESIRQAIQDMPDIAKLSRQVLVDQTPEGLRIQLVDQDGRPMF